MVFEPSPNTSDFYFLEGRQHAQKLTPAPGNAAANFWQDCLGDSRRRGRSQLNFTRSYSMAPINF